MANERPKRFVVTRSKWARGGRDTYLLNWDGSMCCLGFISEQCGVPRSELQYQGEPEALDGDVAMPLKDFLADVQTEGDEDLGDEVSCWVNNTTLAELAIDINDDDSIEDATRERMLKELFAKEGVDLVFEDGDA